MPSDSNVTSPIIERDPLRPDDVRPVELMAGPTFERFSIGEALHNQFLEIERGEWAQAWETQEFWQQEYPSDPEAYRAYMREVLGNLKESSAVQELRQAATSGQEISNQLCDRVELALKRAEHSAIDVLRGTLSPEQITQLRRASTSEIDYGFRDLLLERMTAGQDVPLRRQKKVLSFLVDPKARNVQYMGTKEILNDLRHSLGRGSADQLQREVQAMHRYEATADVSAALTSDEFHDLESQLN